MEEKKENKKRIIPRIKHRYGSDLETYRENNSNNKKRRNICDTHIDGA